MNTSTRTQVAWLVMLSIVFSHVATFLILFTLYGSGFLVHPSMHGLSGLEVVARLYDSDAGRRQEVIEAAALSGIRLRTIDGAAAAGCRVLHPPQLAAWSRRTGGAMVVASCSPALPGDVGMALRTPGGTWLGIVSPGRPPPGLEPPPPPMPVHSIIGLIIGIAGPTLLICLWATRRVTDPLRALAASAGRIDASLIDTEAGEVSLPAGGTTEIRLLTEALRDLISRLRAYAAEQRRMVAGISHDLRTPLTRMRLRVEAVDDPALRQRLERDVQTMQIIVDSSLTHMRAKDGAFSKQDVDVGALLQTLVDNAADAGADVVFEGPLHLALRCDPGMVTRAVENLIDNAIKFAGRATVRLMALDKSAVIEVEDDGPGIADAMKPLAFEPYYRGDASRSGAEGTGLGLSITRAVVAAHDGQVALLDAKPCGLCVRMSLPV
jgi:signal transduction histidine kinase